MDKLSEINRRLIVAKVKNDLVEAYNNAFESPEPLQESLQNALSPLKQEECINDIRVTLPDGDEPNEDGVLNINLEIMFKPDSIKTM